MTKLIYIIGTSFSGSTFLDNLLGCNDDIISLGETINLTDYIIHSKNCMCGSNIKECDLWKNVVNNQGKNNNYYSEQYLHYNFYKYLSQEKIFNNPENKQYAKFLFDNFRILTEITEKIF